MNFNADSFGSDCSMSCEERSISWSMVSLPYRRTPRFCRPLSIDQSRRMISLSYFFECLKSLCSLQLPTFNLYGHNETFVIEVIRLKTIDWQHYRKDLEEFCRYLFEYAFSEMNTDSLLHFDLEQSTSKLLPCFLTRKYLSTVSYRSLNCSVWIASGEIDTKRMASICGRRDRSVRDSSELSTDELYYTSHLTNRFLFVHLSDHSLRKRASDQRDFKVDGVRGETYADYFQSKYPGVRVRRDAFLATMKGFRKARLNYLHDTTRNTDTAEEAKTAVSDPVYFPIELLRYAPMNRFDWQWIHRLPSLLHRISQLYYVERLRKELAENIQCYSVRFPGLTVGPSRSSGDSSFSKRIKCLQ